MPWKKAPPGLVAAFDKAFPPGGERKQMFGYPCGFVNGNMFGGLFEDRAMVRLPKETAEKEGAKPFSPMPGRPMTGYYELPSSALKKPAEFAKWLRRGYDHTASLPPKAKKTTAKRAAPKTRSMRAGGSK